MQDPWEQKNILITIKTYPEFSKKYTETVCSAGILADTKKLIRIYPIRYRYLDGDHQFSKYQWISAKVKKTLSESRPESHEILEESIIPGAIISPSDNWVERDKWVLNENTVFTSVETLRQKQESDGTSLGMVRPAKINDVIISKKSDSDIEEANIKKDAILQQLDMFEEKKDLDLLPVRFKLSFTCEDNACTGHEMSILDWEIGQLYRRVKSISNWKEIIRNKILRELCGETRETFLFMGNMAAHRHIFCICGFYWPPKQRQFGLFK